MKQPKLETLSIEQQDGVATLFMDRPEKRNAMNQTMFEELGTAADYLRDAGEVKVIIMTGRGSAFSSGLDLSSLDTLMDMTVDEFRVLVRRMQRNFRAFELMEKPVIAMVNGFAFGAGMQIALACDIILASTQAQFGLLEVNLGLVTDLGATQRLPRYIGIHRAKELIMTGKKIDAAEAERIGLVNAVYSPDELEPKTRELADHMKGLSAVAVGLCKIAIDRSRDGSIESGLEYEAQSQSICVGHILEQMKKAAEQGDKPF
ncbi:MAG: enoyl-CoA hydratase/isomerase family protein [Actinobacteria bacterium]|nr:enoyl-CoA hydratase/isomerase family protein [Actinomycetota bacterium]